MCAGAQSSLDFKLNIDQSLNILRIIECWQGIDFGTFTLHMSIGVILVLIIMYVHFSFIFRNVDNLRVKNVEDLQVFFNVINQNIYKFMKISLTMPVYNNFLFCFIRI